MGPFLVAFNGAYDAQAASRLERELDRLCSKPHLILDFSNVLWMDPACIRPLLHLHERRMVADFGMTTVVAPTPQVAELFMHTELNRRFLIVRSREAALPPGVAPMMVESANRRITAGAC
jgi:anti-anti-sigma regulatory factor